MDDIGIVGRDDEGRLFRQVAGQFGAPAYVRRARQTQEALEQVVERCRQRRDEWLHLVRIRLGTLHALAGSWASLVPLVASGDEISMLEALFADLRPILRVLVRPTSSARVLRRALSELVGSIERFNHRWLAYLASVDLRRVNELRDGYNRYYLLEKECALRSPRLARQGFARLPAVTVDDLAAQLPPLPIPQPGEGPTRAPP